MKGIKTARITLTMYFHSQHNNNVNANFTMHNDVCRVMDMGQTINRKIKYKGNETYIHVNPYIDDLYLGELVYRR